MKTDTQQQTKHTPGPWIVEDDKRDDYMMTIRSATARLGVAYCVKDDARLIAAAPDLLAALKLCADKLALWPEGINPFFLPEMKATRAVIAKAEGRA